MKTNVLERPKRPRMVMASLGLIVSVLGFDDTGIALMLTIFALQDSFGTACNVISDGALTMILTEYSNRKINIP